MIEQEHEPELLRIKSVSVEGLFGLYDHTIPLNLEDRVTIIHGPNGVGKTKILHWTAALLRGDLSVFLDIPFGRFTVELTDGETLTVEPVDPSAGDEAVLLLRRTARAEATVRRVSRQWILSNRAMASTPGTSRRQLPFVSALPMGTTIDECSQALGRRVRADRAESASTSQRIQIFLDKVDGKLRNKRVSVDPRSGLVVEDDDGRPLTLAALSSGEQREIVQLYDLLFNVRPNTLVLIDEPELSLHITWQKRFLDDLLQIVKAVGIDALVATHSPFIIGEREDLMVPLGAAEHPRSRDGSRPGRDTRSLAPYGPWGPSRALDAGIMRSVAPNGATHRS